MFIRRVFAVLFTLVLAMGIASAQTQTMLVLDGSGSMWGQIEAKPKISIAREVVGDILEDWNQEDSLGLTVYGHRRKGDCADIEEVIPVGKVDAAAYSAVVNSINPKGKTPMIDAVKIAAESLKYTEEKASVILVSDGKETCNADPCALATELEKTGVDFTAHVIGFDVKDEVAVSQLQCIAKNTGGTYSSASNAAELKSALNSAVKESVSGANLRVNVYLSENQERIGVDWLEVLDSSTNKQVARTLGGSAVSRAQGFTVLPGVYKVVARDSAVYGETMVTVVEGEQHEIDIILNAGIVKVKTVAKPDGDLLPVEWIGLYQGDKQLQNNLGGSGATSFLAPAGSLSVDAKKSPLENSELLQLTAGETVEIELVLNSGTLDVTSKLAGSGEKLGVSWFTAFKIDSEGKETSTLRKLGGSGQSIMQLPVGKYRIQADHGDGPVMSQEVEILTEQTNTMELIFDYAWVKASFLKNGQTVGQNWIEAFEINSDGTNGKRLSRSLGGSGKASMLLPFGKARIVGVPYQAGAAYPTQDVLVEEGKTVELMIEVP